MPKPVATGIVKRRKKAKRCTKKNRKKGAPRKTPLKCNLCNYTTTVQNKMLTHVVNEHVDQAPFSCGQCEFKTSRHQTYRKHLRTHTQDEVFDCTVCDFSTTQLLVLENHIRIHTREIPYGCDMCNYRTTQLADLLSHLKTHPEVNPDTCFLCDNKDATVRSLNAKRKGCRLCYLHCSASFQLTKLHLCFFCQKDCMRRWSYRRTTLHFRPNSCMFYNYVNGELVCKICSRQFKAKIGYYSHMQSHLRNCRRLLVPESVDNRLLFSFNSCR